MASSGPPRKKKKTTAAAFKQWKSILLKKIHTRMFFLCVSTLHIVASRPNGTWGVLQWRRQDLQVEESAPEELEVDCLLFQWKCVWCLFEVHNPITLAQIRFLCQRQPSDWQRYWKKNTKQCLDMCGVRGSLLKCLCQNMISKLFLVSKMYPEARLLYHEKGGKAIKKNSSNFYPLYS